MIRFFVALGVVLLALSPHLANAEVQRTIVSSRVLFGDLVADAPADIADLDLGPAPPAGSSRLYSSSDLRAVAEQAGKKLYIKDSIRAVRAAKRWSQSELLTFVTHSVQAALPEYARLVRVEAPRTLVTAPNVELSRVELGQLPNRRGIVSTSVICELATDGKLEQRLSLPVTIELGERPKPPQVERGASVTLQINLGATRVSAAAVVLQTTAVGTVALVRVVKTRKTLRAKLLSTSTAEVVTE